MSTTLICTLLQILLAIRAKVILKPTIVNETEIWNLTTDFRSYSDLGVSLDITCSKLHCQINCNEKLSCNNVIVDASMSQTLNLHCNNDTACWGMTLKSAASVSNVVNCSHPGACMQSTFNIISTNASLSSPTVDIFCHGFSENNTDTSGCPYYFCYSPCSGNNFYIKNASNATIHCGFHGCVQNQLYVNAEYLHVNLGYNSTYYLSLQAQMVNKGVIINGNAESAMNGVALWCPTQTDSYCTINCNTENACSVDNDFTNVLIPNAGYENMQINSNDGNISVSAICYGRNDDLTDWYRGALDNVTSMIYLSNEELKCNNCSCCPYSIDSSLSCQSSESDGLSTLEMVLIIVGVMIVVVIAIVIGWICYKKKKGQDDPMQYHERLVNQDQQL